MRISAICQFEQSSKTLKRNYATPSCRIDSDSKQDIVEFRGKNAVKGAGIGAIVGLGALAVISGGLATPIAYALYAGTLGTAGGMLGHVVDKTDEDNKNNNGK